MIVVVGEALVDVVERGDGSRRSYPGGSPANVAVGLARLGHHVMLVTRLGDDDHGRLVRDHLLSSGVRLHDSVTDPGARTSTAVARLDDTGAATYDFDLTWDVDAVDLPEGTRCLHVGSLGTALDPGRAAVAAMVAAARERGILVSYDPNVRPTIVGGDDDFAADVARWITRADVVKASSDDIDHLHPDAADAAGGSAADVLAGWRRPLGVVTRGDHGFVVVTPHGGATMLPSVEAEVVDTVGAGDSFMAALLDALDRRALLDPAALSGANPDELVAAAGEAAVAAAITCGRAGADPPDRAELDAALAARRG